MAKRQKIDIKAVLTKKELILRQFWLGCLIFLPVIFSLFCLFGVVYASISDSADLTLGAITIGVLVIVLALLFLPSWVLYFFAYKKHGTRYLTFNICLSLLSPLGIISEGKTSLPVLLIGLPLWILWMYLSLKLRKINKKILAQPTVTESQPV